MKTKNSFGHGRSVFIAGVGIFLSLRINLVECQFNFPSGGYQQIPAGCTKPNSEPYPDPFDCKSYYQCFAWMQIHLSCAEGGYYDATYMACIEGPCGGFTTKPTTKPKPKPTRTTPRRNPPLKGTTAIRRTTKAPPRPPPTPPPPPPTTSRPGLYRCASPGFFPHPSETSKYIICALIRGRYYYYVFSCPPGLCYLQGKKYCGTCPKKP